LKHTAKQALKEKYKSKAKKTSENNTSLSNFPSLSPVFDDTKEQKCCGGRACECLIWILGGIFFISIFYLKIY
jgi:hypothetical protein